MLAQMLHCGRGLAVGGPGTAPSTASRCGNPLASRPTNSPASYPSQFWSFGYPASNYSDLLASRSTNSPTSYPSQFSSFGSPVSNCLDPLASGVLSSRDRPVSHSSLSSRRASSKSLSSCHAGIPKFLSSGNPSNFELSSCKNPVTPEFFTSRKVIASTFGGFRDSRASKSSSYPTSELLSPRNSPESKPVCAENPTAALSFCGPTFCRKPLPHCTARTRVLRGDGGLPVWNSHFLGSNEKESGQCALPTEGLMARKGRESLRKSRRVLNEGDGVRSAGGHSVRADGGDGAGRFRPRLEEDEGGNEENPSDCLYLRRTIYDGEVVEHYGPVVILGDVKQGGHVLADGDIIVLGRLQGHVYAGRAGNIRSRVFATTMEPREIRICDSALFCPKVDKTHVPRMAVFMPDGSINIQPAVEEFVEKEIVTPVDQHNCELVVEEVGEKEIVTPVDNHTCEPLGVGGYISDETSEHAQIHQKERLPNRRAAQVALVTGLYVAICGIALLGYPKVLFGILFDLRGVTLGWVQVGAILAVVFGVYYIGTAIGDMRGMIGAEAFYLSTVVGRMFLFLSFTWLVLKGAVPRPVFLFGAVNLVGALVMLKALLKTPLGSS